MTHIANVPHILLHGITHRNSPYANPNFTPIGDPNLISTRDNFQLENGRLLGEYIPFYFGARTPMLYVIQKGFNGLRPTPAHEITYVVTSIQQIINAKLEFIFTDGHAVDSLSSQFSNDDIAHLETLLDWSAIKTLNWKSETDLDLKRRKQAEFLVLGDIPASAALGFVVYNEQANDQILKMGVEPNRVHSNKNHYFEL